MKSLSIGAVARKTSIRSSTLRYYEDIGILPRPARVNGRRRYDQAAIQQIDMVKFAQQAGFTLQEIKCLLRGFGDGTPLSARWRNMAQKKLRELDLLMNRVERMRQTLAAGLECGCVRPEDCKLTLSDAPDRKPLSKSPTARVVC